MPGTLSQLSDLGSVFDLGALVESNTKAKVWTALRKLIAWRGNVVPASLTAVDAGAWQVWMRDRGMPTASIRSYFSAVSQAFSFAVGQGVLQVNPWRDARKVRPQRLEVVTFSEDQMRDLIDAAGRVSHGDPSHRLRWTAIFLIAAGSGPRAGEIENARWEDFDLEEETLRIRYRPDCFGEHWRWGTKGRTDRLVPLSQAAMECLYRLREVAAWRYPILPEVTCRRLQSMVGSIPDRIRKQPNQNRQRDFRAIREMANEFRLTRGEAPIKDGGLHQMRKTAVSKWARRGLSLADAQYAAGHRSPATTQTYYIAVEAAGPVSRVRTVINSD